MHLSHDLTVKLAHIWIKINPHCHFTI